MLAPTMHLLLEPALSCDDDRACLRMSCISHGACTHVAGQTASCEMLRWCARRWCPRITAWASGAYLGSLLEGSAHSRTWGWHLKVRRKRPCVYQAALGKRAYFCLLLHVF
eukprot:368383-Pelagomonas_calceolata.AAC.2